MIRSKEFRQTHQSAAPGHALDQNTQHLLLAQVSPELVRTVAVAQVADQLVAVEHVRPRRYVAAYFRQRLGNGDLQPAEIVDEVHKIIQVHEGVIIWADAEVVLERIREHAEAADSV